MASSLQPLLWTDIESISSLTTTNWTPVQLDIRRATKKGTENCILINGQRKTKNAAKVNIENIIINTIEWIHDFRRQLTAYEIECLHSEHLFDLKKKFLIRLHWELEELCMAPLAMIRNQFEEAFGEQEIDVEFPSVLSPYGQSGWGLVELLNFVEEEINSLERKWEAVDQKTRAAGGFRSAEWDVGYGDSRLVPMQGSKELLLNLFFRLERDKAMNNNHTFKDIRRYILDPEKAENHQDMLRECREFIVEALKRIAAESVQGIATRVPHIQDVIHHQAEEDIRVDMQHQSEEEDISVDMRHQSEEDISVDVRHQPEEDISVDMQHQPEEDISVDIQHQPKEVIRVDMRHPYTLHACFLCGVTGATLERIHSGMFQRRLLSVRDQRISKHGWIRDESDCPIQPRPNLDMSSHFSQAFDYQLNPIAGCERCRKVRAYMEICTGGDDSYGLKTGKHACAEHLTLQRCKQFESQIIGPTEPYDNRLDPPTDDERLIRQFFRSIDWSLNQGKKRQAA